MSKNRKLMSALTALSASAALLTTGTSALAASHKVVKNDSLWALSKKYGVSISSLKKANSLSGDIIYVGQTLKFTAPTRTTSVTTTSAKRGAYTVTAGDTLYEIAQKVGVNWQQLAQTNHISQPYTIYVGQKLAF